MALKKSELKIGDVHQELLVEDLKRTQIVQYAGTSGDYNPLHTDEIFATKVAGFPSVFAHGMLTMGMTGKMLPHYRGGGRLTHFGVRFTKQVFPGDTLKAKATVAEIHEKDGLNLVNLSVETTNQNGDIVVSGWATAKIDV
jgi:acyl dehydratase